MIGRAFRIPTILVSAAAAFAGAFFGLLGSIPYGEDSMTSWMGIALGGGSGVAAGILWCRAIAARVVRETVGPMPMDGGRLGVLAGLASTAVLHGGLVVTRGWSGDLPEIFLICVICGVLTGWSLGSVGVIPFRLARERQAARRREEGDGPAMDGTDGGTPA